MKPIKKGRAVTRPENKRTPQMYRNNPILSTNIYYRPPTLSKNLHQKRNDFRFRHFKSKDVLFNNFIKEFYNGKTTTTLVFYK